MSTAPSILLQGAFLTADLLDRAAALAGATRIERVGARLARLGGMRALPGAAGRARIAALADAHRADAAFLSGTAAPAGYRLAVMDMDSTLITIECIDEIADMQGLRAEVSAITAAAMRGDIAYPESLRRRVALLRGLPVEALARVYAERLRITPGAETMLAAFRAAGMATLLVSGGFTYFTSRVVARLGIDDARANVLAVDAGRLTGEVDGPIVDGPAKREALLDTCDRLGIRPDQAVAIGDGANDLPMMAAAGVSIAYRAKPVVRAHATHAINHNGLDAVPPLLGA
ncbi:MAG: phosphoserine phosphatase SerB [Burkholderiales bacterium]|nr:phosphoserine phosphatase SerB [Burkholderiales bacterium]